MKKLICEYKNCTKGKPRITDYIEHINDMTCMEIAGEETFLEHLERLKEYFINRGEKEKSLAVQDFIEYQEKTILGKKIINCFPSIDMSVENYMNYDFYEER